MQDYDNTSCGEPSCLELPDNGTWVYTYMYVVNFTLILPAGVIYALHYSTSIGTANYVDRYPILLTYILIKIMYLRAGSVELDERHHR